MRVFKIGDPIVSRHGVLGKVTAIYPQYEYPLEVTFEGGAKIDHCMNGSVSAEAIQGDIIHLEDLKYCL